MSDRSTFEKGFTELSRAISIMENPTIEDYEWILAELEAVQGRVLWRKRTLLRELSSSTHPMIERLIEDAVDAGLTE